MDNKKEVAIYEAAQIAKTLFWINLLAAVVAVAACIYLFFILGFGFAVLLPGVYAEYVYYRQFTDADYVQRKFGWIYSMVINALFIAAHLTAFIINPTPLLLIAIYPVIFFTQSYRGLRIIGGLTGVEQVDSPMAD